jgi:hypothetical protein
LAEVPRQQGEPCGNAAGSIDRHELKGFDMQIRYFNIAAVRSALSGAVVAGGLAVLSTAALAAPEILKEMPLKGTVKQGQVVYVDDGKCPAGEVKKIIGGDQGVGKSRQTSCVKRPE